jgi:peroxidase
MHVSCADILAFAARDAVYVLGRGNISYNVTGGLKDGVNLSAEYADAALPGSTFSYAELVKNFGNRNFSPEELVVLSGGRSIGVCHKSSPSPTASC